MKLRKELSLLDMFCIACGAMISSGLFIVPGLAYARAGPAVVVSYALAGLLSLAGMLSIAEVTTAMPKAGGDGTEQRWTVRLGSTAVGVAGPECRLQPLSVPRIGSVSGETIDAVPRRSYYGESQIRRNAAT